MIFKKIGIFDSGIGGFSLVKELLTIPGLQLIYYADTAHVPYGNRSAVEIEFLSAQAVRFLLQHQVDAIIIACHTATTNALSYLKAQFPTVQFIDVVDLIISQIAQSGARTVGILGTKATIGSGIHQNLIAQALPNTTIFTQACPLLASAIENDFNNIEYLMSLIKKYCTFLANNKIDTLVLACTHYVLIKELFIQFFGISVNIISGEQTLQKCLDPFMHKNNDEPTTLKVYATANLEEFLIKISFFIDHYSSNTTASHQIQSL